MQMDITEVKNNVYRNYTNDIKLTPIKIYDIWKINFMLEVFEE